MTRREKLEEFYRELKKAADDSGYKLNSDKDFVLDLIDGLLVNRDRYGYESCPCRLASGNLEDDSDIICPCDYRDDDIEEHGTCYCGLYVESEEKTFKSIPERRKTTKQPSRLAGQLKLPVLRCRVCGYLCARKNPPPSCPICGVSSDKFEVFLE